MDQWTREIGWGCEWPRITRIECYNVASCKGSAFESYGKTPVSGVRRVERGESFEVTARGRAVALLVPAPEGDDLARLEAEGSLRRGEGDLMSLAPLPAERGQSALSDILRDMRAEEQ